MHTPHVIIERLPKPPCCSKCNDMATLKLTYPNVVAMLLCDNCYLKLTRGGKLPIVQTGIDKENTRGNKALTSKIQSPSLKPTASRYFQESKESKTERHYTNMIEHEERMIDIAVHIKEEMES